MSILDLGSGKLHARAHAQTHTKVFWWLISCSFYTVLSFILIYWSLVDHWSMPTPPPHETRKWVSPSDEDAGITCAHVSARDVRGISPVHESARPIELARTWRLIRRNKPVENSEAETWPRHRGTKTGYLLSPAQPRVRRLWSWNMPRAWSSKKKKNSSEWDFKRTHAVCIELKLYVMHN